MQQPKPYKVVFNLTTDDPQDQTAVWRWLREVASVNSQSEMEVVMSGRGLALVVPGRSAMTDDVKQAIAGPHVSFKVCEIAMRNQNVDQGQLLPTSRRCRMASAKSLRDRKKAGGTSRSSPIESACVDPATHGLNHKAMLDSGIALELAGVRTQTHGRSHCVA